MSDYHPPHAHTENHSGTSAGLRDFVLGMSDGLTVPFALVAGLSGAINSSNIVMTAGFAELAAGAISMGLGGYLAARIEKDYYDSEERREHREVKLVPHIEEKEVADIFRDFGVPEDHIKPVVNAISDHPQKWVDFMMRFELGLEKPDPSRLYLSPLIIGGAYAVGGMVPLLPYLLIHDVPLAFKCSIGVSLLALLAFGAFKGRATGQKIVASALQTAAIGSIAAAAAYGIARLVVT